MTKNDRDELLELVWRIGCVGAIIGVIFAFANLNKKTDRMAEAIQQQCVESKK